MAKPTNTQTTTTTNPTPSVPVAVVVPKSELVLVSVGGYQHTVERTEEGFKLAAAGLPGDCVIDRGGTGHLHGEFKKRFTVTSVDADAKWITVKIDLL